jgi:hypothetical protein
MNGYLFVGLNQTGDRPSASNVATEFSKANFKHSFDGGLQDPGLVRVRGVEGS